MLKKIFLILTMGILVCSLSCCSLIESPAVNPEILGVETVQWKPDFFYVVCDSNCYVVSEVYTGDRSNKGFLLALKPIAGMQVTCFNSARHQKVCFVAGEKDEDEIEQMFHENYIILWIFIGIAAIFGISLWSSEKTSSGETS